MNHKVLLPILFVFNVLASYSQSNCEVVKYSTQCELKSGKLVQIDTIILQINNRSGEKYSEIEIPFSKMLKLSDLNAWIEDTNGTVVRKLKNSDITDKSEVSNYSLYEDDFVRTFSLKHNSYPYKICYTYKQTKTQFVSIVNWTPVIFSKVSTRSAFLTIILPKDCVVKKYVNSSEIISADTTGVNNKYVFYSSYEKVDNNQIFAEPFGNNIPKVVVLPKEFLFGVKGGTDSWAEFGDWFLNLNKGSLDLPDSEKTTIDRLIMNITDPKEKAKVLYYYLQDHTRYINVSIGIGGFKAYPATYVSTNKYGDCKALTNYMMALLEYAGIKSYYTLINSSREPEKLIESMPCPQFNHIILTIPFGKDTVWLENTSMAEPFGYIRSSIQNRKALLIEQNNSRLINIPTTSRKQISLSRKTFISFNEQGNADYKTELIFGGNNYEQYNSLNNYYNKKEQDEIVKELVPFQNCELINWEIINSNRDSATIRLNSKLNIYKLLKPLGEDFYLTLNPVLQYTFERPSNRKFPLQIPYPINNVDTAIYQFPDKLVLKTIPENVNVKTNFGYYELTTKQVGETFYVIKKLSIFPVYCDLTDYSAFYNFINSLRDFEKKVIVLKSKI
ncbi:MAG TPA: DUF3857 domain-containing protein [Bacteroidales bacterium]|nr:DUF3857 domain-containing protein [Bacteroidales bacterium]